jgi:hypothetical protein
MPINIILINSMIMIIIMIIIIVKEMREVRSKEVKAQLHS